MPTKLPPKLLFAEMSRDLCEGPARSAIQLLHSIDRERFEPLPVFCVSPEEIAALRLRFGIAARRVDMPRPALRLNPAAAASFAARSSRAARELSAIIKSEQIRIVHANSIINLHAAFAAKRNRLPLVVTVREMLPRRRADDAYVRWICGAAHVVHAVSEAVKRKLIDAGADADKICVVYNGIEKRETVDNEIQIELNSLRGGLDIPDGAPIIGMIGSLVELKGHEVALASMRELLKTFPDLRLVIVGEAHPDSSAYAARIRAEARAPELKGQVIFAGRRDDARAFMPLFDVHLQPSVRDDSLPRTVLEAMSAGVPTVASDIGGIPEMVVNGVTGDLVEPGNVDALINAVSKLLTDSELRKRMGAAAEQRALSEFDAENQTRKIMELYSLTMERAGSH